MQIVVANIKGGCGKSTIVSALADILDANIIDHDNQGTITVTSSFSKRNKPVKSADIQKKYVIHDTPPYNTEELKGLLQIADTIIIPCKVKYPDLVALKALVDLLRELKITHKGFVVFNDVRKPHNSAYRELKELFTQNYKDIKKAKTELSSLLGFTRIFMQPVQDQAKNEIKALAEELDLIS